jgi:uncharacterized protein involved in outer membrane biogenesis
MTDDTSLQGFDDPPFTVSRKVKLLTGTALALVGVVAIGGMALPQFLDQAKYKALLTEKVEAATGYSVDWKGDISLSVFPLPHAKVDGLTLKAGSSQIAAMEEASVQVAFWPLLGGRVEVASVRLVKPSITLAVDKSGRQSWVTEKLAEAKKEGEPAASSESSESSEPSIGVDALEILDGTFSYEDARTGSVHKAESITVRLEAPDLTGPFSLKGKMTYSGMPITIDAHSGKAEEGAGKYPVQIKAELPDAKISGEYSGTIGIGEATRLEGDVSLSSEDAAKTAEALKGESVSLPEDLRGAALLQTRMAFDGNDLSFSELHLDLGKQSWSGSLSVTGVRDKETPVVAIDLVPEKSGLFLKGQGTFADHVLTVRGGKIELSGTQVALDGTIKLPEGDSSARTKVDLTLSTSKINLDKLSGSNSGKKEGQSNAKEGDGKKKASPSKFPGMSFPVDGHVALKADEIVTGGKAYKNVKADITASGSAVQIAEFSSTLPAGAFVELTGKVGDTEHLTGLDISATFRTKDVESFVAEYGLPKLPLDKKIGSAEIAAKMKGTLESLNIDGRVSALGFEVTGQGDVSSPLENPGVDALKLAVKHPNMVEAARVFTPDFEAGSAWSGPLDASAVVTWSGKTYHLQDFRGKAGQTSGSGDLKISLEGSRPDITGTLAFGDLVLAAPSGSGANKGKGAESSSSGKSESEARARWSREAIDTAWMQSADIDLAITAKSLVYDYWNLSGANFVFALDDGALTVKDLSAGMFGGQARISGVVKSGASDRDPLSLQMTMKAQNVDAAKLQTALMSKPSDTLSGTLSQFDMAISANGLSPAALVQSLGGKGSANGQNIVVRGIDVAKLAETATGSFKPLDRAGSLFSSFKGGQTEFSTFDTSFGIESGVVNFDRLFFDGPKASLNGIGNVNLPRWTIDLKNTVTVKNTDIPPFDFAVSGPLDNPAQTGGSIIENYLKTKLQNKVNKLLEKEIGKRLGLPTAPEAAPAETPPPEGGAGNVIQPETAAPPEKTREEAIGNILSDPNNIKTDDAVKALEGLFGQ